MVIEERLYPDFEDGNFAHHLYRYYWALPYVFGKRVLDAGCGTGYGTELISCVAREAVGVDYDSVVIEENRHRCSRHPNLSFEVMDVTQLKFPDGSFDVVISFEVYEHIPPERTECLLRQLHRVLKRPGLLILSTPNRLIEVPHSAAGGWSNPYHVNRVAPSELRASLQQHFAAVDLYGQKPREGFLKRVVKTMDFLNLRHHLFTLKTKNSLDLRLSGGVPSYRPDLGSVEISKRILRQSGILIAVCEK